jgi:hypothetical protein
MLAMGILITGPLFILLLLLAIAVVWGGSIVLLAGLALSISRTVVLVDEVEVDTTAVVLGGTGNANKV